MPQSGKQTDKQGQGFGRLLREGLGGEKRCILECGKIWSKSWIYCHHGRGATSLLHERHEDTAANLPWTHPHHESHKQLICKSDGIQKSNEKWRVISC
jgi:hypothetical protein